MTISGYASTGDIDRTNEIVEPSAFSGTMRDYMKFPVLLVNHKFSDTPIGKVIEYQIDDTGLWIKANIYDTPKGREVKLLIDAGVLRSFSIGFNIVRYETGTDNSPFKITELRLIEISIVNSPANMEALIDEAQSKGIVLKSLISENPHEGRGTKGVKMDPKEVQKTVDESLSPVMGDVDSLKDTTRKDGVRIKEVEREVGKLNDLMGEIKDAVGTGEKTSGEIRQLVDRVTEDFKKAQDELSSKISEIQSKRVNVNAVTSVNISDLKSLYAMRSADIDAVLPRSDADAVKRLQHSGDRLLLVDALLSASSAKSGGDYHLKKQSERVKSLGVFRHFNDFAKAMDSSTAGEGGAWVPTIMSGNMIELIRVQEKVAPLFEMIDMPSDTFQIDVEGDDTIATLAAQTTAVVSSFDTTEQTPGTGNVTFTAKKARGRVQVATELNENSAVAMLPYVTRKIIRSISRASDRAIINGNDGLDNELDSGNTLASTDYRKSWDGLRHAAIATIGLAAAGIDLSTFNESQLRKQRALMGKYGIYPSDLAWITSVSAYLMRFMNDLDQIQTLDKYGPNAVILSGEVLRVDNIPLVVSEFVEEDQNAGGVDDGTSGGLTSELLVNRMAWMLGVRKNVDLTVVTDALNDVYQVVAFKRQSFRPAFTPSTSDVHVTVGYNVSRS